MPESVSVLAPCLIKASPVPVPLITPANAVDDVLSPTVKVWVPNVTLVEVSVAAAVARDLMVAPDVVPEISKAPEPLKVTSDELAMVPVPKSANLAVPLTVVVPA